jgi:hypothetical protein
MTIRPGPFSTMNSIACFGIARLRWIAPEKSLAIQTCRR